MAFSDPYEEWKAKGRPGGTYTPPAPAPAPSTPPPPGPPAPTSGAPPPPPAPNIPAPYRPNAPAPAPTPPPPPPPTSGGGGFNWQVDPGAAQRAWQSAGSPQTGDVNAWFKNAVEAGSFLQSGESSSDTAYNKSGFNAKGQDITGMRAYARANGMSEDFDRWDEGQLMAWEKQKDPKCPPNTPYQAFDGSGCIEKPIDSNKPQSGGAGGAGVKGGSGGGAGGAGGGGLDAMNEYWRNLMMQSGSRYTPEAMAKMEGDQFSRARAQEKLQLDAAKQDMAQRGTSRSANQNAAVRQIGVGTGQQIMANNADLAKRKIEADYQDKQAAIKNAQDWVNSMRDYMLRTDMNAIQREQIAAQIRLAQMNITQQTSMMEQQYQNDVAKGVMFGGIN